MSLDDVRALLGTFRAAAEVREKAMDAITAYLERSYDLAEDTEGSAFADRLRAPMDDGEVKAMRAVYLEQTYRSLVEARSAFAALCGHARRDSRLLADLLGRAAAPALRGDALPDDPDLG